MILWCALLNFLAFACLIREENFDRQYLLDYNISVFKESLVDLFRQKFLFPGAMNMGAGMLVDHAGLMQQLQGGGAGGVIDHGGNGPGL